jgi:hypothetical protein
VQTYLPLVRDLLEQAAAASVDTSRLERKFHDVFQALSLATAWQESCWRQFIKQGGKIKPLTSSAGAIGIMQVNPRVWRGFYDTQSLRQDIGYNASAGNEILLRYLVDYVIAKGEHLKTGNLDNLVRATYAVYNGGPGHIDRYRRKNVAKSLREIDQSFWAKYQMLKKDELAVAGCFNVNLSVAATAVANTKENVGSPVALLGKGMARLRRSRARTQWPPKRHPAIDGRQAEFQLTS